MRTELKHGQAMLKKAMGRLLIEWDEAAIQKAVAPFLGETGQQAAILVAEFSGPAPKPLQAHLDSWGCGEFRDCTDFMNPPKERPRSYSNPAPYNILEHTVHVSNDSCVERQNQTNLKLQDEGFSGDMLAELAAWLRLTVESDDSEPFQALYIRNTDQGFQALAAALAGGGGPALEQIVFCNEAEGNLSMSDDAGRALLAAFEEGGAPRLETLLPPNLLGDLDPTLADQLAVHLHAREVALYDEVIDEKCEWYLKLSKSEKERCNLSKPVLDRLWKLEQRSAETHSEDSDAEFEADMEKRLAELREIEEMEKRLAERRAKMLLAQYHREDLAELVTEEPEEKAAPAEPEEEAVSAEREEDAVPAEPEERDEEKPVRRRSPSRRSSRRVRRRRLK